VAILPREPGSSHRVALGSSYADADFRRPESHERTCPQPCVKRAPELTTKTDQNDRAVRPPRALGTGFSQAASRLVETLQARIPDSAVFVGYLDYDAQRYWVVDASGDASFGLAPGFNLEITESFCLSMVTGRSPQLCNDAAKNPVYGQLAAQADLGVGSYLGVPLELGDGSRIGSLCAIAHHPFAFRMASRHLLTRSAPVLSMALPETRVLANRVLRATLLGKAQAAVALPLLQAALST
jgi:GAF domain-containing protein